MADLAPYLALSLSLSLFQLLCIDWLPSSRLLLESRIDSEEPRSPDDVGLHAVQIWSTLTLTAHSAPVIPASNENKRSDFCRFIQSAVQEHREEKTIKASQCDQRSSAATSSIRSKAPASTSCQRSTASEGAALRQRMCSALHLSHRHSPLAPT